MAGDERVIERIPGYCALCISRCGSIAVVEDGRFVAVEPDPTHPTGQALCAKGRAAPQLVHHPERLLHRSGLTARSPSGDHSGTMIGRRAGGAGVAVGRLGEWVTEPGTWFMKSRVKIAVATL